MSTGWDKVPNRALSVIAVTTALTESAPTLATEGMETSGASHARLLTMAPTGQTFSGEGTWLAYYYSPITKTWGRCDAADLFMPAGASGESYWPFGAVPVPPDGGRIAWVPSGITVSGGTALTYWIQAGRSMGDEL